MAGVRSSLALLGSVVVLVGALLFAFMHWVLPPAAPPNLAASPPAGPPLTRHLALIVVDGLRYDIATDATIMPRFRARMSEGRSAEAWAGRVTMTSSAVLALGTGHPGDLDQLINNETSRPAPYASLPQLVQDAGLLTAATGDHAWFALYPSAWDLQHPDPPGAAIDVDYNPEIFEAAYAFAKRRPNLLVAHFVTPDHQAHAYGILSERYRAHMRDFDQKLDTFVRSLPEDFTVFVMSDHGATDTGTHGSDTPLQRRTPIFALGPGIRASISPTPIVQVDLPTTFAALLGTPPPTHSKGFALVDWLDVSDEQRLHIACAELQRLQTLARASGAADAALALPCPSTHQEIRHQAERAQAIIQDAAPAHSRYAWLLPAIAIAGASLLSTIVLQARLRPAVGFGLTFWTLAGLAAVLVREVERLPGDWPNRARAALYALAHIPVLWALLRPAKAYQKFSGMGARAAILLPGALLLTVTRTTQAEVFVLALLLSIGIVALGFPPERRWTNVLTDRRAAGAVALISLGFAISVSLLNTTGGALPSVARASTTIAAVASTIAWLLFAGARYHAARERKAPNASTATLRIEAALGILLVLACQHLRLVVPPAAGLALWWSLPVLALALSVSKVRLLAELLLAASVAVLTRHAEVPGIVLPLLCAQHVAKVISTTTILSAEMPRKLGALLLSVSLLFSLCYLQRVGLNLGLGIMQLDFSSGAFSDPNVSMARVGIALGFKHAVARGLLIYAFLLPFSRHLRETLLRALLAAELLRAGVLLVYLYVCSDSFWTSLYVISDVPHALLAAVVAAAGLLALSISRGRGDGSPAGSHPHDSAQRAPFLPASAQ